MKTYSKKFSAQRAARAEFDDDAIAGIDYRIAKTAEGWTWQRRSEKPKAPIVEAIDTAIEQGMSPKQFVAAAEKVAGRLINAKQGKRAAVEEAARQGVLPEPPDFSAETHKRFRNKLANLVELATAGDIVGLKAVVINPVSSSPKAMARYRDLCVIALLARR